MMIRRIKSMWVAAAISLVAISTPALSQDTSWFVGLGIGQMKTSDECPAAAAAGASCDNTNTTWKAFGGHQFNSYLGVEFAIADLGKRTASLGALGPASATFTVFEALIVGTIPLSRQFSVYGKAGVFQWDADFKPAPGVAASADADGHDYTYGLGVKYSFSRNYAVRLEWQRYNKIGDPTLTGKFDADVFGVGALLSF